MKASSRRARRPPTRRNRALSRRARCLTLAGDRRAGAMTLILRRVGRYDVLREIGRGGMATVYLARQSDLDRHVALKELAVERVPDASFAERFLRESRMAGKLTHPNIVTV